MARQYTFGEFRLDIRERRLSRGEEQIRLEPKAFDLLCHLIEHAGRLVDKQELVASVWARAAVSDNSLTRCVHQVRAALDDHADHPAYIETVPGAGYRFVAPVSVIEITDADSTEHPLIRNRLLRPVPLLLTAVTTLVVIVYIFVSSTFNIVTGIDRIAVMPLTNLTGDSDQQYFVDGIHEALIAELSRIKKIDVISRTSVMRYRNGEQSIPEIARQLEVDAIVEGSVSRSGDQLTITTQLIATEPERHLWAKRFHRNVGAVFEITTEIARSIAAALAIELSPAEVTAFATDRSVNAAAYDAYLFGRFHLRRRNEDGYRQAEKFYKRAIELDPEFVPAYTMLAETFGSSAIFGMRDPASNMPKARKLGEKAISIDSTYYHGHIVLAAVNFYWDWDWAGAEKHLGRALALNPNASPTFRFLAEIYSVSQRHDDALLAMERARELDPFHPNSQVKPAYILYLKRDYEESIRRVRPGIEIFKEFWQGYWIHCLSLSAIDRHHEAIEACEAAVKFSKRTPLAVGALGFAYAAGGRRAEAKRMLAELQSLRSERYVGASNLAIIYGALGDLDQAFSELERAYQDRDILLVHAENLSYLDPLRADARFNSLRNRFLVH